MTAERVFPSGAWQVSDVIGDQLVTWTYYGVTKAGALRLFGAMLATMGITERGSK